VRFGARGFVLIPTYQINLDKLLTSAQRSKMPLLN